MNTTTKKNHVVIVTGMSGAGKTQSLKILANFGYDIVDNVPFSLLPHMFSSEHWVNHNMPLALGIGVQSHGFDHNKAVSLIEQLRKRDDINLHVLFMTCSSVVLEQRFRDARLHHPVSNELTVPDCIQTERTIMETIFDQSDLVVDSTHLSVSQLKDYLSGHLTYKTRQPLLLSLLSFSYRKGIPRGADMVFDMRFLRNPYWHKDLRTLNGLSQSVQDYIMGDPRFRTFWKDVTSMLDNLLPCYQNSGKSYLTLAFGCTGGFHRSVCMVECLASHYQQHGLHPAIHHINLGQDEK